jgi:hypothetical protein
MILEITILPLNYPLELSSKEIGTNDENQTHMNYLEGNQFIINLHLF